jgi:hypothetical protein
MALRISSVFWAASSFDDALEKRCASQPATSGSAGMHSPYGRTVLINITLYSDHRDTL